MIKVKFKKLDPRAVIPIKAHNTDTGYDLSIIDYAKQVGEVTFYRTGLSIQPESGYYVEVVPRSSISKTGMMLANSLGIIDEDFTGEILVPLRRVDKDIKDLSFKDGYGEFKPIKLVQMIIRKRIDAEFIEVEELDETDRGEGGFGSTDKVICKLCKGTGRYDGRYTGRLRHKDNVKPVCPNCEGKGFEIEVKGIVRGMYYDLFNTDSKSNSTCHDCPVCGGLGACDPFPQNGSNSIATCFNCNGKGYVIDD